MPHESQREADKQLADYYQACDVTEAPNFFVAAAASGSLQRRVLCGYGLMLLAHKNLMGLVRLRMVFDKVVSCANPEDEKREQVIATDLIHAATDS